MPWPLVFSVSDKAKKTSGRERVSMKYLGKIYTLFFVYMYTNQARSHVVVVVVVVVVVYWETSTGL